MCLLGLVFAPHSECPITLVGNRDEFHVRPTTALHLWEAAPSVPILAGRDEQAKGTWMAVGQDTRWAIVTNLPTGHVGETRGNLVRDWMCADDPDTHLKALAAKVAAYSGFNLLCGDRENAWAIGSKTPLTRLQPGIYAVSNVPFGSESVKGDDLTEKLTKATLLSLSECEAMMQTPIAQLDADGNGRFESPFLISDAYGTRSTTVAMLSDDLPKGGDSLPTPVWNVQEQTYHRSGEPDLKTTLSLKCQAVAFAKFK